MQKVAVPTLKLNTLEMPCPSTVHGLTPIPADISSASPSPNKTNPIIKNKIDINFGVIVNALGELQNNVGIFFVDKKSNLIIINIIF